MAGKKLRYPGLNYFSEKDANIFCGRSEDSQRLYTQIMVGQTLVLHAESGTGKSSLIRAGLLPLLRNLQPELVTRIFKFDERSFALKKSDDFDPKNSNALVQDIISSLKTGLDPGDELPFLKGAEESLWLIAKKISKNKEAGARQPRLLLIFDQFEEFQTFASPVIKTFKKEVGDLMSLDIPQTYYDRMQRQLDEMLTDRELTPVQREVYNREIRFLMEPLNVKLVFVVREDKLGTITYLSDILPDIYKNDFYLRSLTTPNAKLAFMRPCQAEGEFESPPFQFDNEQLVDDLILALKDKDTDLVDPIEIQIVCSNIERNIIHRPKLKLLYSTLKVAKSDIPDILDIINNFYITSWTNVNEVLSVKFPAITEEVLDKVHKKIVKELVVGDHRNLVNEEKLVSDPNKGESQIAVATLLSAGLVRSISADNEKYIQLCHDRFIKPVLEDKLKIKALEQAEKEQQNLAAALLARQEKNKLNRMLWIGVGIVLFIIFGAIGYNLLQAKANREKQQTLDIARITRRTNPQLSFLIAQSWLDDHGNDADFKAFADGFRASTTPSLLGIFYQPSKISEVAIDHDKLSVLGSNAFVNWDIKSRLIDSNKDIFMGECLHRFTRNKKVYFMLHTGKYLEVRDENKKIILQDQIGNKQPTTAVSHNGRWILVGKDLLEFENPKKIISLPVFNPVKHSEVVAAAFLRDPSHLAVSFTTGYKIIYKIDRDDISKTKVILVLPPSNHQLYTAANAIAIDTANKYLVAGNTKNEVEVWRLPALRGLDFLSAVVPDKEFQSRVADSIMMSKPLYILKGHSDNILSIAISASGKYILSGSRDHYAILWQLATGKKIAALKGMTSSVVMTAFSKTEDELITTTAQGEMYVWSTNNIARLYKENRLNRFSPFDYYNAGLDQSNPLVKDFSDTTSDIIRSYQLTFDYISNMPDSNAYLHDDDYLHNLDRAFKEIANRYNRLASNPAFKHLTIPQQQYIKQLYNRLILRKSTLLDESDDEEKAKVLRKGEQLLQDARIQVQILDTSDMRSALIISEKLINYSIYYRDLIKNYNSSLEYLNAANDLILKYEKKNPDNPDLLYSQTVITYYMALNYLYLKQINNAQVKAKELNQINNGNQLSNVVMILSDLYNNSYDAALSNFYSKENIVIWTGDQNISLRTRLIALLTTIRSKRQLTPAAAKFLAAIQLRPNPVKLVKVKRHKTKHRHA